jgi:iron complex outermembrane recepter protein
MRSSSIKFASQVSLIAILASTSTGAFAQTAPTAEAACEAQVVVVTGSRIPHPDLTSTSPVSVTSAEQIAMDRSVTIEDVSSKLPPLLNNPSLFNTLPDTYNVLGRTIGLSITWRK